MSLLSFLSAASGRSAAFSSIATELGLKFSEDTSLYQRGHCCHSHCGCHRHSDRYSNREDSNREEGLTTASIATQALLSDILKSYASAASFAFNQSVFNRIVGVPDNAAAFATVDRKGRRIDNGRTFGASELKWTRSDGKSDGRGATVVTYAFDDDFGINGISTDRAQELFTEALQTWADFSPLDFREVEDPGVGSQVDIYVQSEAIDGRSGTLAFAYFPSVGDITFDTAEVWNESMFLETTVHELGHSLGLDHEDDTDAIMNSVLRNRFTDGAFLFEDDINGIHSLYGEGKGSVTRLDGTRVSTDTKEDTKDPSDPSIENDSTTVSPAMNLVINGSFEDVPLEVGESNVYKTVKGWSTISGAGFQVDRRPDSAGKAADGTAWVELDTFGQNATIGQNIDTVTGQSYNVSVDFSDGGRPERTTSIEVFWEGKQVDTLSGGGKGEWRRFEYELKGGDRTVSTLAFRAIGPSDNIGGFIDNIVVTEERAADASNRDDSSSQRKILGISSQPEIYRDPISGDRTSLTADLTADTSLFHQHDHSAASSFV